jgi:AcrR family transcriptional regulator
MKKLRVATMVKNSEKVLLRRKQILDASIIPFKEKGYHRTTTREIAANANMSFGAIYEYVKNKEDILYLFFEALYDKINDMLANVITDECKGISRLRAFIKGYFTIIDQISAETNIMYRETRSLSGTHLTYVFSREDEFTDFVKEIVTKSLQEENIKVCEEKASVLAHNIIVQGHMWAFRSWSLKKEFNVERYIEIQTDLLINSIVEEKV